MAGIIELRDKDDKGFLTIELRDVLLLFDVQANRLIWSILDLEAVGSPDKLKRNILEIENEARQSARGVVLSWEELQQLADSLVDIFDAVIVGCRNADSIPRLAASQEIYNPCEIVIEMIDSAFWRIYARDDAVIQKLSTKFNDVITTHL